MTEYINQRKLLLKLMQNGCPASVLDIVLSFPAVDTTLAVHGKWVPSEGNPGFLVCSACGDCYVYDEWVDGRKWRYCPNCGAKMDEKDEDDGQKD